MAVGILGLLLLQQSLLVVLSLKVLFHSNQVHAVNITFPVYYPYLFTNWDFSPLHS